jgi:uncharacterized protein YjiS (DUF1127 family)
MSAVAATRRRGTKTTHANPLAAACRSVLATVALWAQRVRERRELTRLSDYELRDFGASRSTAIGEASKPFWRP